MSQPAQPREETTTDAFIELDGLRKTFDDGEVVACEDMDLQIREDEFVVLVGPSGCGKTTTLRCISGLEQPDSGRITADGRDITRLKPKDREFAFVFQSIALFPHMSVRENMRFGLDMNTDLGDDEKRRRITEAAEILGIEDLLDRKPTALSGGQQQRVSIGRAMVLNPNGFLLDEPFSALDANLRNQLRVEIKKIQRQQEKPMIFVTHDQEEAMNLGDRIVVMRDGHIQQVGTPYDIYNDPKNLFVAQFIGSPSTNLFDGKLTRTDGSIVVETELFDVELASNRAADVAVSTGESVILGVRPEHVSLAPSTETAVTLDATLSVVEPNGSNETAYFDTPVGELAVLTDQGCISDGSSGDTLTVGFDPSDVWLFEESGERLL